MKISMMTLVVAGALALIAGIVLTLHGRSNAAQQSVTATPVRPSEPTPVARGEPLQPPLPVIKRRPAKSPTAIIARPLTASDENVRGIELVGENAELATINTKLREQFDEAVIGRKECMAEYAAKGKRDSASYMWTQELVYADAYVVVIDAMSDIYCGGAHPTNAISKVTLATQSGRVLKPGSWLVGYKDNAIAPSEPLAALIRKHYPRDDKECVSAIAVSSSYSISPSAGGLVFSPTLSHAEQACADAIAVPYEELGPFLTKAGCQALGLIGCER